MTHHDATEEPGGADEVGAARDALGGRHTALDARRGPLERAVPNLPARDLDATIGFYTAFGFAVGYRDGGWLELHRGDVELEFFLAPEHDPYSSWFMASIRLGDLDEFYAAARAGGVPEIAVGIPRLIPVALREGGQRAGYLIDPDGTQLHLIEHTR